MIEKENYETITYNEVEDWCEGMFHDFTLQNLKTILTGEYPLDEAREDILIDRNVGNTTRRG